MSRKERLKFDLSVQTDALLCPNPEEFYSKAYISEVIADNFRTLPNVKSSTKLSNVVFGQVLQSETCSFTAPTDTFDAKEISVCGLSAMAQVCQFDLESSWVSKQMAQGSNGNFEVASFMNYYWGEMAKTIQENIALLMWQGDTTGTGSTVLCDGFEKKLAADTSVIDVAAPTNVTSANVLALMQDVYEAASTAVLSQGDDLRFYVSRNVATAYAYATASANTIAYLTEALPLTYLNVPIVICDGMSDDKIVFTSKNNLVYAFDALSDSSALKAVNLSDTIAEPVIRTRANMKIGFEILNPGEIVYAS
jgi:hypothetical protein